MADIPYGGSYPSEGHDVSPTNWTNWIGAVLSLALVVGIGTWGYQLVMRDVTGIPVVRAVEGPMRVLPEDPGGRPAQHQGLAVNSVASEGAAEGPVDQVILAPPPLDLSEEDAPGLAITAETAPAAGIDTSPVEDEGETRVALTVDDAPKPRPISDDLRALADQIAAGVSPLEDVPPPSARVPGAENGSEPAAEEATQLAVLGPGVAISPRPRLRPANAAVPQRTATDAAIEAAVSAVASPAANEVDPDTIPAGTRLVQLGAFASPSIAREQWDVLSGRFDGFLDDKTRVIERATSGGRIFYRLRAMGFADLNDARRFCSALVAENADCIPVVTR